MISPKDAYDQLCCYSLTLGDKTFVHQHVVDAFAAQNATHDDKPIRLTFALVGLYLHLEHGFTGREVQLAHMKMAKNSKIWPRFTLPDYRGQLDAVTVLSAPDVERISKIDEWCRSVWEAYSIHRSAIRQLLITHGIVEI